MRLMLKILVVALCAALPLSAQESDLVTLETGEASRGWEGVGRLDINGKGFCTAAMIRDRLILTAAHCVYGDNGRLLEAGDFTFHAGLRAGRSEASRGISRFVAHPNYEHTGTTAHPDAVAVDIAVLELDRPIRRARIQPFAVASQPVEGDKVGVVSYGKGRTEAASMQETCSVLGQQEGMVVMTCKVDFGSSGSPVFMIANGIPRIVSVVSAMAQMGSNDISLGTSLQEPLQILLRHFESIGPAIPGGSQRVIAITERNDTGAKFVRP